MIHTQQDTEFYISLLAEQPLSQVLAAYPVAEDFLTNMRLENVDRSLPFASAIQTAEEFIFKEFGIDRIETAREFAAFLETFTKPAEGSLDVRSLTISGGQDKDGNPEAVSITVKVGEVVSLVGPTGSGKSRVLADIECLAQRDTPSRRRILVNEQELTEAQRLDLDGRLVAQLSQNMNFVMDLSVRDFLAMHAKSRLVADIPEMTARCFRCANELAGEQFSLDTKVTQLSGGQSRALMIADTANMSRSPVVLIDEIENAGIDRRRAIALLAKKEKIVLLATHDPLLALGADKRIVIRNGAIQKVITTTEEERAQLSRIEALDAILFGVRNALRAGEAITAELFSASTFNK